MRATGWAMVMIGAGWLGVAGAEWHAAHGPAALREARTAHAAADRAQCRLALGAGSRTAPCPPEPPPPDAARLDRAVLFGGIGLSCAALGVGLRRDHRRGSGGRGGASGGG